MHNCISGLETRLPTIQSCHHIGFLYLVLSSRTCTRNQGEPKKKAKDHWIDTLTGLTRLPLNRNQQKLFLMITGDWNTREIV